MVAIALLCVFITLMGSAHCQSQPQVISTNRQLKFVSADNQDIVFQPGIGGKLTLNAIDILDKSSLVGANGPAGAPGSTGAKGEPGKDGVNGAKGDQGPQGVAGATGPAGASGVNGQVGPQGQKGQAGQDGAKGADGAKGGAGITGPIGPKGDMGPSGPKGDGATGPMGPIGPKGEVGNKGAVGPPGPQGPTGNVSSSSSGGGCTAACATSILPQCPAWVSKNLTLIPATGNTVVELALSGFSGLYHPSYEASYTCRFKSARQAVFSAEAAVTLLPGSSTHHVIDCVAPAWKFGAINTFKENVTVSLWYLDTTEVAFVGRVARQTATYYVGVTGFSVNKSSIYVQGAGLDTTSTYICRFNLTATNKVYDSAPSSPSSPAAVTCQSPSWPTGTSRSFSAYTTVWVYQSGRAQAMLPFTGISASVSFDLCNNGIKDGDETDLDCGGSCSAKCALGKACKVGSDCSSTALCTNNKCVLKCTGWIYDGVCLQGVKTTTGADTPPSGCNTYRPAKSWGRSDYLAICLHFAGSTCVSIDTDSNGGLCTTPANPIMGYENHGSPDVWLASPTFTYRPVRTSSQDCKLVADPPGTIVYACR